MYPGLKKLEESRSKIAETIYAFLASIRYTGIIATMLPVYAVYVPRWLHWLNSPGVVYTVGIAIIAIWAAIIWKRKGFQDFKLAQNGTFYEGIINHLNASQLKGLYGLLETIHPDSKKESDAKRQRIRRYCEWVVTAVTLYALISCLGVWLHLSIIVNLMITAVACLQLGKIRQSQSAREGRKAAESLEDMVYVVLEPKLKGGKCETPLNVWQLAGLFPSQENETFWEKTSLRLRGLGFFLLLASSSLLCLGLLLKINVGMQIAVTASNLGYFALAFIIGVGLLCIPTKDFSKNSVAHFSARDCWDKIVTAVYSALVFYTIASAALIPYNYSHFGYHSLAAYCHNPIIVTWFILSFVVGVYFVSKQMLEQDVLFALSVFIDNEMKDRTGGRRPMSPAELDVLDFPNALSPANATVLLDSFDPWGFSDQEGADSEFEDSFACEI
jgi:hypothetical protein